MHQFNAADFIAEYRDLGGALTITDDPEVPDQFWFGMARPYPDRTNARAAEMRAELVASTAKEDAVISELQREDAPTERALSRAT
jgi:hypothetical protein